MENRTRSLVNVINVRYSCDQQSPDTCEAQERTCRGHLRTLQISDANFCVIKDEALSGTLEDRPGMSEIRKLIDSRRLGILIVSDQSRLSRGVNAKGLIQDVVYAGGRFISVNEGTDTERSGWENSTATAELQHSLHNTTKASQVRQSMENYLYHENRSIGDMCFGYRSKPFASDGVNRQRPRMEMYIDEDEATIVRWLFNTYAEGTMGFAKLTRHLNAQKVPKGQKSYRTVWNPQDVKGIISQEKYIGIWTWGTKECIRNSRGKIRHISSRRHKPTIVKRPELRIVDQSLWDRVQLIRKERSKNYRIGTGTKHPSDDNPVCISAGLVHCGVCGSRIWTKCPGNGDIRYAFCPRHYTHDCSMHREIQVSYIDKALLGIVKTMCESSPEWVDEVTLELRHVLEIVSRDTPAALATNERKQKAVTDEAQSIIRMLGTQTTNRFVMDRLNELEAQAKTLEIEWSKLTHQRATSFAMPDSHYISEKLSDLTNLLGQSVPETNRILRSIFQTVTLHINPEGDPRLPSLELDVKFRKLDILTSVLGNGWREHLEANGAQLRSDCECTHLRLIIGYQTLAERFGAEIIALQDQRLTHKQIAAKLGITLQSVDSTKREYRHWKGIKHRIIPIWKEFGPKIDELVKQGLLWSEIGESLGMADRSCESSYDYWRKKTGQRSDLPPVFKHVGARIHRLRQEGVAFTAIASLLKRRVIPVKSLYCKWWKATDTIPIPEINERHNKMMRLGPIFADLRKQGKAWMDICRQHDMKYQTAASILKCWRNLKR